MNPLLEEICILSKKKLLLKGIPQKRFNSILLKAKKDGSNKNA